jgi:FtsH-binding integral membrane protein
MFTQSHTQQTVFSPAFGDRAPAREARAVFGQTMGLIAVTTGFAGVGAYAGRDLTGGAGLAAFFVALAALIGLQVVVRRSEAIATGLLFVVGLALGTALGPMLNAYLNTEPGVVYQAAGATTLFVGALGSYGYATSRDVSRWARPLFFALLGLLAFGLVSLLLAIPGANIIYALLGLAVFGAYTVFDFNRLRRSGMESAVPIAAGIFIDIVNVFQFFLMLFGGGRRR